MGRRPRKDNQHQQQRMTINLIGDRRPAQQRRHRTRQPTNHNVLWCRPLKVERVDEGVTHQRSQGQPSGQGVDPRQQHHHAQRPKNEGKNSGSLRVNLAFHNRPAGGARHNGIDMLVGKVIDRRS